jgi:C-terminal processing protease CtpA/Prc
VIAARNFSYRQLPGRVGYIDFFSMEGSLDRFRADLDGALLQAMADSSRSLVFDMRRNGGGDSRLGDELLSHITGRAYRMSSRKEWKMSAEYRAYIMSMIRAPYRQLGLIRVNGDARRLLSGPPGTIVTFDDDAVAHRMREPRFSGPVCFLIGPRTFSSAVDMVDAIKTYELATLVGEETGGKPNSFGEVYEFRTQRLGFLVSVSSALFVRANGDTTDHRGVMPDVEIKRTASDIARGVDPILSRQPICD